MVNCEAEDRLMGALRKGMIKLFAAIKLCIKLLRIRLALKNKKYTHLYVGSPLHGNLGDQQIRNSSIEFLENNGIHFLEIDMGMIGYISGLNLKNITTICLQGGGNFGDVYLNEQLWKDNIIRQFKDKKIIFFPQTLFYEDKSISGEMNITKQIISNHPNLILTAREMVSFDAMKELFPNNNVILTPDIVMSSNYTKKYQRKRKNQILFLTRMDIEKSISDEKLIQIKEQLKTSYKIIQSDTTVPYAVYDILRNRELRKIFKKIARSKLVITDRLHGMIFSVITGTPCVVFSNYNHKIKSSYETWLKGLDSVVFCDDPVLIDIVKVANSLIQKNIDWHALTDKFNNLSNALS